LRKPLRIDADAEAEVRAAANWYEMERPGLGQLFLQEARDCAARIRDNPESGSRVPGSRSTALARRILMKRFPYSVVFLDLPGEIRILAFAHMRRRPGYWSGRITEKSR
jgi:toxin ParE1/3/4